MMNKAPPMKTYYVTEYVNTETGEILKKSNYEKKNFRIIKHEKKYELKTTFRGEQYTVCTRTNYLKEHEQYKLIL